ncbi:MAG TPA: hypothetical protein VEJ46_05040 [Candidatus Acidoferrum sp.]|nr:hypothetical protein [Candidatus Acidoferrum sp.]
MRHFVFLALCFAALVSNDGIAQAQSVGLFGAIPPAKNEVSVPPRIRSLLPPGAKVRVWGRTELTTHGEEFVLFDVGSDRFYAGRSIAAFVRGTTLLQKLYLTDECYLSHIALFNLTPNALSLAITFRCFGDGAEAQFVFLAASPGHGYRKILDLKTDEGRVRIHKGTPILLETWTARPDHDPPDPEQSCVWCEHHYEIRTYELRDGRFQPRPKSEITDDTFDPGDFLLKPLEVVPADEE